MKGKVILGMLALLIAVSMIFAACARPAPTPSPSPGPTPTPTLAPSKVIRIATAPEGRLLHGFGVGAATVLKAHTNFDPRILTIGPGIGWISVVPTREVEYGLSSLSEMHRAYNGLEEFKGTRAGGFPELRLAFSGGPTVMSLPVRASSDIKTLKDFKGKSIPTGYPATFFFDIMTRGILANGGLTYDDIIKVPVTDVATGRSLFLEGRVVTPGVWVPGIAQVLEMDKAVGGLYFPSLDPSPEAVARTSAAAPGFTVESADAYAGVTGVTKGSYLIADVYGFYTHDKMPDDDVYLLVKTLYDYNAELVKQAPTLANWTLDRYFPTAATVPYHPGAIKFAKEKGLWTSQLEALQTKLLAKR